MITIRRAEDRGHADHGWLNSWHTFSFASYYDPKHMGFRSLRVINDDRVMPGRGFGAHPHSDMEIISYVLEGSLAHKDSTGEEHVIGPNTIQTMSAGTGIVHSEFNPSKKETVHFLQIWIEPAEEGVAPSYQQIAFAPEEKKGKWRLIAGPRPEGETAAIIHQNACVYAAELKAGEEITRRLAPGRHGWIQIARGSVTLNEQKLEEGDGASLTGEDRVSITGAAAGGAEFLFFDLT